MSLISFGPDGTRARVLTHPTSVYHSQASHKHRKDLPYACCSSLLVDDIRDSRRYYNILLYSLMAKYRHQIIINSNFNQCDVYKRIVCVKLFFSSH